VRYTWKLSDTNNELVAYSGVYGNPVPDGCLYQYKTPVVATRQVGLGGSSPSLIREISDWVAFVALGGLGGFWSFDIANNKNLIPLGAGFGKVFKLGCSELSLPEALMPNLA
jgi:hypothetical protein